MGRIAQDAETLPTLDARGPPGFNKFENAYKQDS